MSAPLTFFADASQSITTGAKAACGTAACNTTTTVNSLFMNVSNVLIFLVGAISVIMIIVGGLRYVTSGGDSKSVSAAKDTILYSVVGLVVAIASYAIVSFVVKSIK